MLKSRKDGQCIYCGKGCFSDEHYLPRCLGKFRGFEMLKDRICKDCNNSFSEIERLFCRMSPEAFFRKFWGIEGRKHHRPYDPFQEKYHGIVPIEMRGKLPEEDLEVLWEINPGERSIHEMSQIVIRDSNGQIHQIRISESMMTNPSELADKIQELDIENAQDMICLANPEEQEKVTQLLSKVLPNKQITWQETPPDGRRTNAVIRITIFDKYPRAIAKIAFHYFLKQFPRYKGSETEFEEIRKFIKTGENIKSGNDINRFVKFTRVPIARSLAMRYSDDWSGHLLAAFINYSSFYVWAQFSIGAGFGTLAYNVHLGRTPSRIIYQEACAHRFVYFSDGQQDGYDGKMEKVPITRLYLPF